MNCLTPVSQVFLHIDKALQDELVTDSGLKLYIDPSYRKEWQASVTATITELPAKVNPKEKNIIDNLQVGDEVAISYRVVADFEFKGDGHRFMECVEPNEYVKDFRNGKGDRLSVYALPKRKGLTHIPMWVGVCQDKRGEVISGVQGTEHEVSRWMAQFPLGKTDDYSFNNFFAYNGEDYWKCDLTEIFAKRVKGHLVAIGNRVICVPIDEEVPDEVLVGQRNGHTVQIRYQDRARVLSSGNKKFKKGEIVSFEPDKLEKYSFFGKDYYLINENFIQGKWQETLTT